MTAKVENAVWGKRTKAVYAEPTAKVCANCEWYDQHYSKGWSNVAQLVPVNSGCCCVRVDKLSEGEAKALRLLDNKLTRANGTTNC